MGVDPKSLASVPAPETNEVFAALALPDRAAALRVLGAVALKRVEEAIRYYELGIPSKRAAARLLRMTALLLGAIAGLTPLVLSLLVTIEWPDRTTLVRDLLPLSTTFAALAVTCIGIDKLFGFSSGWMRFIGATLDLQSKRSAFATLWLRECLRAGGLPGDAQVDASMDVLGVFLKVMIRRWTARERRKSWCAGWREAPGGDAAIAVEM